MRTVLKNSLWVLGGILLLGKYSFAQELTMRQWGALFFSKEMRKTSSVLVVDAPVSMVYQGVLQGLGKKPIYWINEKMQESLPPTIKSKGSKLIIYGHQEVTELEPGQTYDIAEKKVTNNQNDQISN